MDHNFVRHTFPFSWDMQLSSMPHFPCFQFVSGRLAQSKLYVTFILSGNQPSCISAWPISKAVQSKVIRIFRKAYEAFPTAPAWIEKIAFRCADPSGMRPLEARPSDNYLIRRSLIQHEIIFSGEGLTLLTVDHIYTFKQCLIALANLDPLAADYKGCITSCEHLLRRINTTYTGVRLCRPYLERAYDMHLAESALDEVHKVYLRDFHELGVRDVTSEPDIATSQLAELESPVGQQVIETPEAIEARTTAADLAAFLRTLDPGSIEAWDSGTDLSNDSVTYPRVPALTKQPEFSPSLSVPSSRGEISTTICSRCLVNIGEQNGACMEEMSMFMSPEWEKFRRIGLGIS